MKTTRDRGDASDRFQYSVLTLLVVVTATCILFRVLQWLLPDDFPIGSRIGVAVMIAGLASEVMAELMTSEVPGMNDEGHIVETAAGTP